MSKVVISQPMLFPWPGFFEQLMLAETYVYHDDAIFSLSSFTRRIQVKKGASVDWMTIPLQDKRNMSLRINDLKAVDEAWPLSHRNLLLRTLKGAPYLADAIDVFDSAYKAETVCDKLIASIEQPCRYLGIGRDRHVAKTSELGIAGRSWQRVLAVVLHLNGKRYLTGHGAANYMDHLAFEEAGVSVEYLKYSCTPWPQFGGTFTPYVTILDLIAHAGPRAVDYLHPALTDWRDFVNDGKSLS